MTKIFLALFLVSNIAAAQTSGLPFVPGYSCRFHDPDVDFTNIDVYKIGKEFAVIAIMNQKYAGEGEQGERVGSIRLPVSVKEYKKSIRIKGQFMTMGGPAEVNMKLKKSTTPYKVKWGDFALTCAQNE